MKKKIKLYIKDKLKSYKAYKNDRFYELYNSCIDEYELQINNGLNDKEAFELAKKRAIELMNQHTQDAIIHIYGNLDTYIDTMIESIINQNKKGSN